MGVLTTYQPVASTSSVTARVKRTEQRTCAFQCLVVSASEPRREMLLTPITDAGWDSLVCNDARSAWTALSRDTFQMSVVDLQGAAEAGEFGELCEQLATKRNMLLMICGNEGKATEEIWARQLGTWLYLPGVSVDSDLRSLCSEGRSIAERLNQTT